MSGWIENKLTFEFTNRRNFLAVYAPREEEEVSFLTRPAGTAGGSKPNTEQLPTHQAAATRGAALLPWQRFITDERESDRWANCDSSPTYWRKTASVMKSSRRTASREICELEALKNNNNK